MDPILISAGIASWFGFTAALLLWAFAHATTSLAPLSASNQKSSLSATFLRYFVGAFMLFGTLSFAALYGQLIPSKESKDIFSVFLFVGAGFFYLSLFFYRRLEKRVPTNT